MHMCGCKLSKKIRVNKTSEINEGTYSSIVSMVEAKIALDC